ncbi:MAG TPA: hypothetical protein VHO68_06675 [Bacteroidales bacterium]|nr:hypothetical protein [Bacteroidales bacterium]
MLHDNILIFWLTYLGLYIGTYSFYSHELFTSYKLLSISLISLLMLHGPFLYFYIQTIVSGRQKLSGKDLLHLLPFALFNLYIFVTSFSAEQAQKLNIEKLSGVFNPPVLFLAFLILTALSGTIYFILTIRLFRKLDIKIFEYFSYSYHLDLKWLKRLVLVFWNSVDDPDLHYSNPSCFQNVFDGLLHRWIIPFIISLCHPYRLFRIEAESCFLCR